MCPMILFSMWSGSRRITCEMVPGPKAEKESCPPLSPKLRSSVIHLSMLKNQSTASRGRSFMFLSVMGFMLLMACILLFRRVMGSPKASLRSSQALSMFFMLTGMWANALPARYSLSLSGWSFLVTLVSSTALLNLSWKSRRSSVGRPLKMGILVGAALTDLSQYNSLALSSYSMSPMAWLMVSCMLENLSATKS